MKKIGSAIALILFLISFTGCGKKEVKMESDDAKKDLREPGIYATIKILYGQERLADIVIKLYPEKTPVTVLREYPWGIHPYKHD